MKFNTSLLHGAFRGEPQTGATLTPIYQSSAFEQESAERLEKIFHNQAPGFSYTRINNPTVEAFEKRMTVLEGGKSSVACDIPLSTDALPPDDRHCNYPHTQREKEK